MPDKKRNGDNPKGIRDMFSGLPPREYGGTVKPNNSNGKEK